jgi:hypothetical protein
METTEVEEAKEVEVVDMPMELTVFDPIDIKLAEAKEKNANLVFDYEDKKGNKEARSWVAHLRTFKAPVNEMHKTGKAEAMKYCKEWDKAKNKRITAIEEMIEHHDKPLRKIKAREEAKKAEEDLKIQQAKEAEEEKARLELEAREKAVAEERAKLEAEKAEIEQKAREARAALKAKRDAEYKAARDLEAAENRRLAEVQAVKDKAVAEAAEKERKLAEEKEKHRIYQLELESQEQERQANVEHRKQINKEVYEALFTAIGETAAKMAFQAIYTNKIPHVTINY